MYNQLAVVLFAFVATVACNDIRVGSESGRVIYDEKFAASPAIWRQAQKVVVSAQDGELISGIIVTDNRDEKNGEAQIIDGGEGANNVSIQLLSPAVFRGFDFHVVVYATKANTVYPDKTQDVPISPVELGKDLADDTTGATDVDDFTSNSTVQDKTTVAPNQPRPYRDADKQVDPIVKYVKTTIQDLDVTTVKNSPVAPNESPVASKNSPADQDVTETAPAAPILDNDWSVQPVNLAHDMVFKPDVKNDDQPKPETTQQPKVLYKIERHY